MKKSGIGKKCIVRISVFAMILIVGSGFISSAHSRPSALDKLSSSLKPLVGHPEATMASAALVNPLPGAKSEILKVYVRLHTADPAALQVLKEKGFQITAHYGGLVSGSISASQLLSLADLDIVSTIQPIRKPFRRAVTGEGVEALRANLVLEGTPMYNGKGVKVGIISDSFGLVSAATPVVADIDNDGIKEIVGTDSQLSGDLPVAVKLIADASPEDIDTVSDEGRAMAEIVYDIAPGAELYFRTAWYGIPDFAQGIIELAQAGCNIIVDDIGYFEEPIYQDGEIGQAIAEAAKNYDVVYLSSAGNDGSQCIEAAFHDIDPNLDDGPWAKIPKGNDLHVWNSAMNAYDPYLAIRVPPQVSVFLLLYWENPFSGTLGPGAFTDYDLYALSEPIFSPDKLVAASDNAQGFPESPMGDAEEIIMLTNENETDSVIYYIVVNKHHGVEVPFKLILSTNGITLAVQGNVRSRENSMIYGHPLCEQALAVAAVNVFEVLSEGQALDNPRRIDPVYYTSQGGEIPFYYAPDGSELTEPQIRFKPDIASVDGASNSFFGAPGEYDDYPVFYGTSASAPHAAAVVALMRQANPQLKADEIRALVRKAATDISVSGVDRFTGWGLLYADTAVQAALNPGAYTRIQDWDLR